MGDFVRNIQNAIRRDQGQPEVPEPYDPNIELRKSIQSNNLGRVNQLLEDENTDVNQQDRDGNTPLIYAAYWTHIVDIGVRLIQAGADINHVNIKGETPLITAVMRNNMDFAELLLEQDGLNINVRDNQGKTALMYALPRFDLEIIEMLLDSGADPKIADNTGTAPLTAVLFGPATDDQTKIDVMTMLLAHGASINRKAHYGKTVLMFAAQALDVAIVNYLVTVPRIDVNAVDDTGKNALIWAAEVNVNWVEPPPSTEYEDPVAWNVQAARQVITTLLQAGVDIDVTDNEGRTALSWAAQYDRQLIPFLLEMGADPRIKDKTGFLPRVYTGMKNEQAGLESDVNALLLLTDAEKRWILAEANAKTTLKQKTMISHRVKQNKTFVQPEITNYIFNRAEYSNLCQGLQTNLNRPEVVALAKSLNIDTGRKTKAQLCTEISEKLII